MTDQKLILKEWIKNKLSELLDMDIPDQMADYILSIKEEQTLDSYFKELLNFKDAKTRRFINEFAKRKQTLYMEPVSRKKYDDEKKTSKNVKNYTIQKDTDISFDTTSKKNSSLQDKSISKGNSSVKKKNKYVNFYAKDGETVLLKGRYYCECEAKKHELINNCLTCGRIVCQQEGSGPCFVCDSLVCTPEEQMVFNGDTSKASKLYEHLLMQEKPKSKALEEAISHRNRLLEFDKNSKKHTHVFDDDSDYFCSVNPWLTIEEREICKKKEEEFFNKKNQSRLERKMTLKIDGLKLVEDENFGQNNVNENDFHIEKSIQERSISNEKLRNINIDHLLDPYFTDFKAKFKGKIKKPKSVENNLKSNSLIHVMDKELHQMKDEGYCISIHQPWASFLVNGIRNIEGRTWYTPYRGKLWIASTGVRISRQDALTYENTYRLIKGDIKFPADYPSGSLVGCADLVDCLTQEQYRFENPDGELEDPYVFIFENCQALPVRYPLKGKPNIYKLDEKIHTAAKICIRTVEKVLAESDQKVKSFRP